MRILYPVLALIVSVLTLPHVSAQESAVVEAGSSFSEIHVARSGGIPRTANRSYRLFIPKGAGESDAKFPLVIYMHGAGSKGEDNLKPTNEPMPAKLASPEVQARFPCFILVPQCRAGETFDGRPNNWVQWRGQKDLQSTEWTESDPSPSDQLRGAISVLDEVLRQQPVDMTRVYLTGVSMGGSAAWWWGAFEHHRFAAIISVCGLSEVKKAPYLVRVPVWAFHGTKDPVAPVQRTHKMFEAIRDAGGTVKFTEYRDGGHDIESRVLSDRGVLEWLFSQRKQEP